SAKVSLLVSETTGSLLSRASAAGIDEVLIRRDFVKRYAEMKARYAGQISVGARFEAESHCAAPPSDDGVPGLSDMDIEEPPASAVPAVAEQTLAQVPLQVPTQVAAHGSVQAPARVPLQTQTQAPAEKAPVSAATGSTRRGSAFLLPVVSGGGGAGKSVVSALVACMAQQKGHSTLVLDFDLRFGDMRELMGLPNALAVDEAVRRPELLANVRPCEGRPALLAAPARLETAEELVQKVGSLLDALEGKYDVIVVNTGSNWDEVHATLLERATKVLFLVDQRVSSVRACKHALELCERCGIATGSFAYALNRCSKTALLTSIDVSCALQGAAVVELADGQPEVEELMSAGKPEELLKARNAFAESLRTMAAALLPPVVEASAAPSVQVDAPKRGLFGRRRARRKGSDHVVA
ncbi:MAG: chromosome partitioning protein ParA, partial [Eggerthellaceae bacterium]|nr:chromosome partitioning protein ParA [Eggerthellaceae bacterium]